MARALPGRICEIFRYGMRIIAQIARETISSLVTIYINNMT